MKIIIILSVIATSLCISGCSTSPIANQSVTPLAQTEIPTGNIYFYSSTCPHCQTVKEYIASSNIQQKLYFLELEISNNSNNADILRAVGRRCLISEQDLSVPLFWDGNQCYVSSTSVISYFQTLQ
ncbi:MAG TPA: hypothetical protein PK720_00835 [bacterium]|nr:hypothetical protein [bacterium]